jgi:phospholipid/cholesterol/gamma-HCH transport system substrate-binding protein
METRASHIAVGAFAMLLLLGGFALVIWVSKYSERTQMASHFARFLESVQGVNVGTAVLFGGIPIGHVTAVNVDPVDSSFARIDMTVEASAPIRSNSVATLELQGFSGEILVEISRGNEEGTLIKDGSEIPSRYTPIQRLIAGMPGLVAKGNELLDNAATVLSPENVAAARRVMANMQQLQTLVATNSSQIGTTLERLAAAGKQITVTNAEFRDLAADVRATGGKFSEQVNGASRDIQALQSILGAVADDLHKMVDENRQPIDQFTATGFFELSAMVAAVQLAVRTIKRIAGEIAQNPTQYFFQDRQSGFQAPGMTRLGHAP